MDFITDPPIAVKIQKMAQRIRWQHSLVQERGIDQTELVLDDGRANETEFSFLVIGDSGSGSHRGHSPQRKIAELMLQQGQDCRFVIHTGDVIYLVGSSDYYLKNFIDPYREFLVGGEQPRRIRYNQITFKLPFFLVPGNHDYYDLPLLYGLLAQTAAPLRYLLRSRLDLDVGWRGSQQGMAYAQAFLDYLQGVENSGQLAQHLDQHYRATASDRTSRCLRYRPQEFTRLPNRYYQFRYGGIDFFAVDSNTFNAPIPLSNDAEGDARRQQLEQRLTEVQQEQRQLLQKAMQLNASNPLESEQIDDCRTKIQQLEEIEKDIEKQLHGDKSVVDTEQLDWLKQRLIESWHSESRGRVIFFHHPPYVTEATKWDQSQTLAVRYRLRSVLNQVKAAVGELAQDRPMVDLVLNGHAHCLEYLRTGDTGHGDANINWIVCGGSGYSLRRQRSEGPELPEVDPTGFPTGPSVAKSQLFVGRTGQGYYKRRPYSCLRIDVQAGNPPRFVVHPYVAERYRNQWYEQTLSPIQL